MIWFVGVESEDRRLVGLLVCRAARDLEDAVRSKLGLKLTDCSLAAGIELRFFCWSVRIFLGIGRCLLSQKLLKADYAGRVGVVGGQLLRNDSSGGSNAQLCNFDARVSGIGLVIAKSKEVRM